MKLVCSFFLLLFSFKATAQDSMNAFIRMVTPAAIKNTVRSSRQFITGVTCKTCILTINSFPVKIYSTGAFAYEVNLAHGDSTFNIEAHGRNQQSRMIHYSYPVATLIVPIRKLDITSVETFPEGNLILVTGDRIKFKVKGLTGCLAKADDMVLYELPARDSVNKGVYQGEYIIKATDSFFMKNFSITLKDSANKSIKKETGNTFSVLFPLASNILSTKGRLAHLLYGLGDDRLGGAKIGYIDSMVLLNMTGKVGSSYKVQLSKKRVAYIPDDVVELMPKGTFTPESLTTSWRVYGDSVFDYVNVGMFARLPYESIQETDPSRIVVDIFGAVNNTNWITQYESLKEIKNVYYEQVEDDVLRVTIELNHPQHWGHRVYYKGNMLVIRVKHQPAELLLNKLTIAVDAGHGGSNEGARGITGAYEKNLTLAIALKLEQTLKKEGAKVIMTRSKEQFVDNKERILFYRDSTPDLLISIHLNSAGDPVHVSGTSTYYRYIGFRNLSHAIYKRVLELGLKEYGNTGSFNFMLNSPTEYPNALVETVFISNPEDEMKIMDDGFQQQLVDKIVMGIRDFLVSCREK